MKYLIVNADDYGLTKGVCDGIIEASVNGVVRSTTMLVNTEHFDYAISLLRKSPHLGVGVHLNLTCGAPLSPEVPTIVGANGCFYREVEIPALIKTMKSSEIEMEFTAQIEKLLDAGVKVTHLDTHNNIYKVAKIAKVAASLAVKYNIGLRRAGELPHGIKTTDRFSNSFHNNSISEMNFKLLVKKYEREESLEIMCHPGHFDMELMEKSRYAKKRQIELSVLTKYELQAHLERAGIKLINFGELP